MADVSISDLTQRQPAGAALVPYSEDGTTYSASVTQVVSLASSIPSGGIILWSGAANAIPYGWVLCDGNNSTPNLVDRFVLGAGTTTPAKGTTGGSKDAIVVSHSHTVTDPGHAHTIPLYNGVSSGSFVKNTSMSTQQGTQTPGTNSATTGISIAATGAAGTNANLPPYYALCYIMKL
jgi:microcystin-dependent protein